MRGTVAAALVVIAGCSDASRTYQPLVKPTPNDAISVSSDLMTETHFDRVAFFLTENDYAFERMGPTEIVLEDALSRELMWNVTTKSEDEPYLRRRFGDEAMDGLFPETSSRTGAEAL